MAKLLHAYICPIKLFLKLIDRLEFFFNFFYFELLDLDIPLVYLMFGIICFFIEIVYSIKIQASNFVNLCFYLQCSEI